MKCIGSSDPPCARCAKAGRPCIVQRGRLPDTVNSNPDSESRRSQPQPEQTPSRTVPVSRPYESSSFQPVNGVGFGRENQIARYGNSVARTFFPDTADRDAPEKSPIVLPSIFTTSPYSTALDQAGPAKSDGLSPDLRATKRPRIESTLSSGQVSLQNGTSESPIPERDMVQFIDM